MDLKCEVSDLSGIAILVTNGVSDLCDSLVIRNAKCNWQKLIVGFGVLTLLAERYWKTEEQLKTMKKPMQVSEGPSCCDTMANHY